MTNIFDLLDRKITKLQDLNLPNFDMVIELLDEYRGLDSEVENLMAQLDTWDHKAQRAHEKMKKLDEGFNEYNETKKKFEEYVKTINQLKISKNSMLVDMSEIRKRVEELSENWDLLG